MLTYLGETKYDFANAKRVMSDIKFIDKIRGYPKDKIPPALLNKVKTIVHSDLFNLDTMKRSGKAVEAMGKWCKAVKEVAEALKIV